MRFLLAVFALALSTSADAVVLCAKPRGDGTYSTTVKIREVCTQRETTLDPGALGLRGPQGPGLVVLDGQGRTIGSVLATTGHGVLVAGSVGDAVVRFEVLADSIPAPAEPLEQYYETNDCTGAVFLDVTNSMLPMLVGATSTTALFPTAPPTPRALASISRAFGSLTPSECTAQGWTILPGSTRCCMSALPPNAFPAAVAPVATVPLATLGTPPFTVSTTP